MTSKPTPPGQGRPDRPAASSFFLLPVLRRLQPHPETLILLLAVLIGTGAGSGVVLFRALIHFFHTLMFGEVSSFFSVWGHWTLALIPLLGGLAIGAMRWGMKDFGPGLATLMEVVQGSRDLLLLNPITKMLAASISLGTGASLGPEGPSVEIGAYFSLLLGQVLKVSQERQRLLLSAGAAAGLAAGFNAPIAGVFFALEVVMGSTFAASTASVVLLAAVVSAWIAQIGLGVRPAFTLPAYEVRSLLELPLYVGLGLLASLVSLIYVRLLSFSRQSFNGEIAGLKWLARIPRPLHPVIGGICLGLVSLKLPQILGVGYETVESMLQDVQFPLHLMLALLVVKLLMTAISFGSGFVGGVFAPALFLGASLGSVYGKVLAIVLPHSSDYMASSPAYAMVGMAAVLAGSVRAPLTAILLLFELTHDYRIVLPLMAAVGISIWLIEYLHSQVVIDNTPEPEPLAEAAPPPVLLPLAVTEAMQPVALRVAGTLSLTEAAQSLITQRCHSALVVDADQQAIGIITLRDVHRLMAKVKSAADTESLMQQSIQELCTTDLIYAYADEPVTEAVIRMSARGLQQLPVVDREQPEQVIGLLTQENIALAHSIAKTRDALHRHLENEALESEETSSARSAKPEQPDQGDELNPKAPVPMG